MEKAIPKPSHKRIAVVTGGNKGIGLEICRQLASRGVMVILTARDEKKGLEAVEKIKAFQLSDVGFHQLDVTDKSSIASLASYIKTHFGMLDILVNNAGIMGYTVNIEALNASKPRDSEKGEDVDDMPDWMEKMVQENYEMAEECLKTNYNGIKYVTEALIPLLQSSNSARIVNVSSVLGQLRLISNEMFKQEVCNVETLAEDKLDELMKWFLKDLKEGLLEANGWPTIAGGYKVSKALVNAYTRILAKKYPTFCINCVNPGFVKTELNWNTGILTVEQGARGPVMLALLPDGSPSGLFFNHTEVSTF